MPVLSLVLFHVLVIFPVRNHPLRARLDETIPVRGVSARKMLHGPRDFDGGKS
jgi:hypothetical protein